MSAVVSCLYQIVWSVSLSLRENNVMKILGKSMLLTIFFGIEIWNFTSITRSSISIEWELFSPVSFYEYDLCDSQGTNVDNGNAVKLIAIFNSGYQQRPYNVDIIIT